MADWWPDWSGETVVIVASGPSAKDVDLEIAKGRAKIVAVNSSVDLVPYADALFACDLRWWRQRIGCPGFAGIKITSDPRMAENAWGVRMVRRVYADTLQKERGLVGWGGNSGFQAFNIVVQCDPAKIILVGFDATIAHGLHWHGEHPKGLNNPTKNTVVRWGRALDGVAPEVARRGIVVINCSPISVLEAYPKMSLAEALAWQGRAAA